MKAKGSITIEASFLLPLFFISLFLIIELGFYLHDSIILTSKGYEYAQFTLADQEANERTGEGQKTSYISNAGEPVLLGAQYQNSEVNTSDKEIRVELKGVYRFLFSGMFGFKALKLKGEGYVINIDPAADVRRYKKLKVMKEEWLE